MDHHHHRSASGPAVEAGVQPGDLVTKVCLVSYDSEGECFKNNLDGFHV